MKIIHIADVHYHAGAKDMALASLDKAIETGREQNAGLFGIAGDLFDRGVQNSESGGFPSLVERIREMLDIAPIVALEGTPTHDIRGCYDVFQELMARYQFRVLRAGTPYFLTDDGVIHGDIWSKESPVPPGPGAKTVIFGCPEPQKSWLLANKQGLGRNEATQAVNDEMCNLFMGYGALRKDYPDIPCLFIGHLNVSGASMANGQMVPGNEITVGRDDLAMIGADYYALGHIHLAQQIGDLPAYYPGSAYPVNWGETDQKGFNIFDTETKQIERVNFSHPPRKKVITEYQEDVLNITETVKGFLVWQEVMLSQEQSKRFNSDYWLDQLIEKGALPGSRVTTRIIPTETVRAAEITEKSLLREKVQVYAECSDQEVADSIFEKADQLEAQGHRDGITDGGAHIRITGLGVRGLKGIWKGQGREEIFFDFDNYDPGLIALIGKNGSGKTTLIENMHPYPDQFTRSGTLQSHFYLKDSFRELFFTDERTGTKYRALAVFDPTLSTPKAEFNLFCKNGEKWTPLTNGRIADYEEKIAGLFGSMALFLRSAFVAQKPSKNNPSFANATKGEKKETFRELSGLDYLQAYSKTASEKAKTLESEITRDRGKADGIVQLIDSEDETEKKVQALSADVETVTVDLQKSEETGKKISDEVRALSQKVEENNKIQVELSGGQERFRNLTAEKKQLMEDIDSLRKSLSKRDEAEKILTEFEELKRWESTRLEDQARLLHDREKISLAYAKKKEDAQTLIGTFDEKLKGIQEAEDPLRLRRASLMPKIDSLIDEIESPLDNKCPTCAQVLPADKLTELQAEKEAQKLNLKKIQEDVFEIDKKLAQFKADRKVFEDEKAKVVMPEAPVLPEVDDAALKKIQAKISAIDIDVCRDILDRAQSATSQIENKSDRIQQIDTELLKTEKTIDDLKKRHDSDCYDAHNKKQAELERARQEYIEINGQKSRLEVQLEESQKHLSEIKERKKQLDEIMRDLQKKEFEVQEWRYLEHACGPDGIQALELDALAPNIADVANRLLSAAYGPRFLIEFRTTRIAGKGSKTKQVEDFQIMVLDSEHGDEQSIDTLSGGEAVWILKAIYDAFGIIRARNTGTKFLTVFLDEADGALDPEAREQYFKLLEAAHHESGRHHTVVITHSPEIQQMIGQRAVMSEICESKNAEVAA